MRVIKGIAALLALALGLAGVPAFLVIFIGNPLPAELSWSGVVAGLTRPDDGTIMIGLITAVAWVAWLVFAVSVVAEVVALVSPRRVRIRLPGLGVPQRLASGLVLSVVSLAVAAPQAVHAEPVVSAPQVAPAPADLDVTAMVPAAALVEGPSAGPERAARAAEGDSAQRSRYAVQRGDDLWSLAERFYGEGRDWRRIAAANPDLLTGGPDRLQVGWRLRIPDVDLDQSDSYLVRRGDTLSTIAERELGDRDRWPELFEANRFQLTDADELPVGIRLEPPATTTTGTADKRSAPQADEPPRSDDGNSDQNPTRTEAHRGHGADTGRDPTPEAPNGQSGREPDALPMPRPQPSTPDTSADGQPGTGPAGSAPEPAPTPQPGQPTPTTERVLDPVVAGVAGVGGLLAAAVVAGARSRRRVQLQARPVGRRIASPPAAAQAVEAQLGRRQRPMSLRTLDLATRSIGAHSHHLGVEPPELALASVSDDRLVLDLAAPSPHAPDGFRVEGARWCLDAGDVDRLRSTPGLNDAARPYPALVTLGSTADGAQVVADLEALRLTSIESDDPALVDGLVDGLLAAIAVELSCSPWAEDLELMLVGTCEGLPEALGRHSVTSVADLDIALDRLSARAASQRAHHSRGSVAGHRVDPDLADAWAPTVLIISQPLTRPEQQRLTRVVLADPPVSIAAIGVDLVGAPCRIRVSGQGAAPRARIVPYDVDVIPQLLTQPASEAVIDLVAATGRTDTTPAPWWLHESEAEPDPPDNVTYLGRRFGGWARTRPPDPGQDPGLDHDQQEGAAMNRTTGGGTMSVPGHPVIRLLGPVELTGAAGPTPPRAAKQCLEYCVWLLEHPGTSAQEMALALAVAEGTRRSNMSRLRTWLGSDELGQPYLPDAYSGRILLHPSVSSDWQRLQILTGRGVNRTSTGGLEAALQLVRGAPLADAAPGQWHWAEGLRTDMISVIRDIGVELSERALAESDVELARWAATRALVVAPGDELLLVARVRTEHRAGNDPEVERLTLQLAAHARALEVDLRPETVDVLQEMMEGRVRARLA